MDSELSFYTTTELIEELMRRRTFMGVVIRSEREHRNEAWQGEQIFKVHLNSNLTPEQASRLLDRVAEHIERTVEND